MDLFPCRVGRYIAEVSRVETRTNSIRNIKSIYNIGTEDNKMKK